MTKTSFVLCVLWYSCLCKQNNVSQHCLHYQEHHDEGCLCRDAGPSVSWSYCLVAFHWCKVLVLWEQRRVCHLHWCKMLVLWQWSASVTSQQQGSEALTCFCLFIHQDDVQNLEHMHLECHLDASSGESSTIPSNWMMQRWTPLKQTSPWPECIQVHIDTAQRETRKCYLRQKWLLGIDPDKSHEPFMVIKCNRIVEILTPITW